MERKTPTARISRRVILQGGLGVVLVGASILGVAVLLEEGNQTRTVAVSRTDVPSGVSAGALDIELLEIPESVASLPSLTGEELQGLSEMMLNRPLRPGDVLSARDFSLPENVDAAGITIDLSIGEPVWLTPGHRVTLWVAPPASENSFSAPFVLSANVLIDSVSRDEGFAADGAFRQVNILVSPRDIPGVVHALANRYFLYLVPVV
jgi:hypothetical protein